MTEDREINLLVDMCSVELSDELFWGGLNEPETIAPSSWENLQHQFVP